MPLTSAYRTPTGSLYTVEPEHVLLLNKHLIAEMVYPQDRKRVLGDKALVKHLTDVAEEALGSIGEHPSLNYAQDTVYEHVSAELYRKGFTTEMFAIGPTVYLAGAMTGIERFNIDAFEAAREKLLKHQELEIVTIPHDFVPSTSTHQDAMRLTIAYIAKHVDVIVVLPGYENSVGTAYEMNIAKAFGIPTLMLKSALKRDDWFKFCR